MASSPSSSMSEPARIEQVITEFFTKSLHIILESRSPYVSSRNYQGDHFPPSPSSSSSPSGWPRDKWFNLALGDCPAVLENFDLWRQSNLEPLIVDVILIQRQRQSKDPWMENKSEKTVERWIVKYESRKSNDVARELNLGGRRGGGSRGGSSHSSERSSAYEKIYKKTTILLRSLYCTVRLLPAYKVFQDLYSSGRISPFSLSHKISSIIEPFTRAEDADMNHFSFLPSVDTTCGRISWSVSYAPKLEDASSEPSMPISVEFIPDYVGSPTTEKLRRLHCLPSGRSLPTYVSSNKRHSWNNDHGITPCVSPSPSPTYSDSHTIQCSRNIGKVVCSSQEDIFRAKVTTASPYHTSYPESKLQFMRRPGDIHIGTDLQKMSYSGKNEVGGLSELKISSCTSPWIPSRSSSRFSLLDEFDYPFTVGNEDLGGPCRVEISDADSHTGDSASGELIPVGRSSDAAVDVLVQMLKTAAPLQHDFTSSVISSQANKEAWTMKRMQHEKNKEDLVKTARGTASELFISRTTADALEELRFYREVKKLILRRHGSQQSDMGQARNPVSEVSEGGLPSLDIGQTQISDGIEGGLRSLGIGQDKKFSSEGSSES